jgi:hypothetical protein
VLDIIVSIEALFHVVPLNPLSDLTVGAVLVIFAFVFLRIKTRIYEDFLELKAPLAPVESTPHDVREDSSSN